MMHSSTSRSVAGRGTAAPAHSVTSGAAAQAHLRRPQRPNTQWPQCSAPYVEDIVGDTPLVRLRNLPSLGNGNLLLAKLGECGKARRVAGASGAGVLCTVRMRAAELPPIACANHAHASMRPPHAADPAPRAAARPRPGRGQPRCAPSARPRPPRAPN
jgi:hypothetical protein